VLKDEKKSMAHASLNIDSVFLDFSILASFQGFYFISPGHCVFGNINAIHPQIENRTKKNVICIFYFNLQSTAPQYTELAAFS
jgi:hypothetical protein